MPMNGVMGSALPLFWHHQFTISSLAGNVTTVTPNTHTCTLTPALSTYPCSLAPYHAAFTATALQSLPVWQHAALQGWIDRYCHFLFLMNLRTQEEGCMTSLNSVNPHSCCTESLTHPPVVPRALLSLAPSTHGAHMLLLLWVCTEPCLQHLTGPLLALVVTFHLPGHLHFVCLCIPGYSLQHKAQLSKYGEHLCLDPSSASPWTLLVSPVLGATDRPPQQTWRLRGLPWSSQWCCSLKIMEFSSWIL
jgi:hypothetical protein